MERLISPAPVIIMKNKILLGLAAIFLVLQAFRPAKNLSPAAPFSGKNDITALHPTPVAVKTILERSCYDCHSDNTRYPWYAEIQPVGWWLQWHINDGRRHLNFAQFAKYPTKRAGKKMDEVIDETRDRGMPLPSYTLIHRGAKLTDAEIAALADWAESVHQHIAGK